MTHPITHNLLALDYSNENTKTLPVDMTSEIVQKCNLRALGSLAQLNHAWQKFMSNTQLWQKTIYQEFVCGNNEWVKDFPSLVEDEDVDLKSLPVDLIIKECRLIKHQTPHMSIYDLFFVFWAPKLLTNQQQTVENLSSFLKLKFPETNNGYKEVCNLIFDKFKQNIINSSCWVFMMRTFRPVKNSNGGTCKNLIKAYKNLGLGGYNVSNIGETITGLLAGYLKTNKWIFALPKIYILCQEVLDTYDVSIEVENEKASSKEEFHQSDSTIAVKKVSPLSLIRLTDNPTQNANQGVDQNADGQSNDQKLSFDAHVILVKKIPTTIYPHVV